MLPLDAIKGQRIDEDNGIRSPTNEGGEFIRREAVLGCPCETSTARCIHRFERGSTERGAIAEGA